MRIVSVPLAVKVQVGYENTSTVHTSVFSEIEGLVRAPLLCDMLLQEEYADITLASEVASRMRSAVLCNLQEGPPAQLTWSIL